MTRQRLHPGHSAPDRDVARGVQHVSVVKNSAPIFGTTMLIREGEYPCRCGISVDPEPPGYVATAPGYVKHFYTIAGATKALAKLGFDAFGRKVSK